MGLLRVVFDALVVSVIAVGRGWVLLIFRPFASAKLVAGLPVNVWRVIQRLPEMFRTGLVIETPEGQDWILRTVVHGFGDVTTRVSGLPSVTHEQVSAHFESTGAKLKPFTAAVDGFTRASVFGLGLLALYLDRESLTVGAGWCATLTALGWAFAVSLFGTLSARLVVHLAAHWLRRRLARET